MNYYRRPEQFGDSVMPGKISREPGFLLIRPNRSGLATRAKTAEIMSCLEPVVFERRSGAALVYGDVNFTVAALQGSRLGHPRMRGTEWRDTTRYRFFYFESKA